MSEPRKIFHSYKEKSRGNWGVSLLEGQSLDREQVQLGAILRIADATEQMGAAFTKLLAERDKYKEWYEREKRSGIQMANRIRALQGANTRLRNKMAKEVGNGT